MRALGFSEYKNHVSMRNSDPGKIDPTKQDERDNDPTRIKPLVKEPDKIDPTIPSHPGEPSQPSKGNTNQLRTQVKGFSI